MTKVALDSVQWTRRQSNDHQDQDDDRGVNDDDMMMRDPERRNGIADATAL